MFVLNSDIIVGQYSLKPHFVKVNKSLYEYVDKALIKVPITARIVRAGEVVTQSTETAKQFNEGDRVIIRLGYNGLLNIEFVGFVSRINFTEPLEVECEGYSYILRNRKYSRTFVNAELIDILRYLVEGTDIILAEEFIPAFKINKLILQEHSGTEALELIRKTSQDTIRMYFDNNMLYAGLVLLESEKRTTNKPDVIFQLSWNVIKDGNLKLRRAKNRDVTVKVVGIQKTGTPVVADAVYFTPGKSNKKKTVKTAVEAGEDGETKVIRTHAVTDSGTLDKMAKELLKTLSYEGYEGRITCFLQPYCKPGQRAKLEDKTYEERSGTYLIESTEVTYGTAGARRLVQIGIKL